MRHLLREEVQYLYNLGVNKIERGKKIREIMMGNSVSVHNEAEYKSWENSLPELIEVLMEANLPNVDVIFEYTTPVGGRIDAIIIGYDKNNMPIIIVVELKQWNKIEDNVENSKTKVRLKIGGDYEYRIHPLQQITTYKKSLKHHHQFCEENSKEFQVSAIAYLHNFEDKNSLLVGEYSAYEELKKRLFTKKERNRLIQVLSNLFQNKESRELSSKFLEGNYVLGKVGYEGIKKLLNKEENAVMISDQIEVNVEILTQLKEFTVNKKSKLIIVKGGPGTGKTILGLHLIYGFITSETGGTEYNSLFTFAASRTLRQIIEGEAKGRVPLLDERHIKDKEFVVIDEAHRFANIDEELDKYYRHGEKFIVVMQDDRQRIRLNENGTFEKFNNYGKSRGYTTDDDIYELKVQKRSGVFGDFVQRLDNFFYGEEYRVSLSKEFDISVNDNLDEIDDWLHEKIGNGQTAKWYAGFCWGWSRDTTSHDIEIDQDGQKFYKPWNPMNEQYEWYRNVSDDSLNQIGCIYTAQGLDYDYTGVIWGKDLKWDKNKQKWFVDLDQNKDYFFKKQFKNSDPYDQEKVILLLNTYRVLLTRALKGTKIWFADKDTEEYFLNNFY